MHFTSLRNQICYVLKRSKSKSKSVYSSTRALAAYPRAWLQEQKKKQKQEKSCPRCGNSLPLLAMLPALAVNISSLRFSAATEMEKKEQQQQQQQQQGEGRRVGWIQIWFYKQQTTATDCSVSDIYTFIYKYLIYNI